MFRLRASSRIQRLAALLTATGALAGGVGVLAGSDHQDTPPVELNPRMDLTDVYAFPGSAPGRIVLVMNTSGFLTPAETPTAGDTVAAAQRLKTALGIDPRFHPDLARVARATLREIAR